MNFWFPTHKLSSEWEFTIKTAVPVWQTWIKPDVSWESSMFMVIKEIDALLYYMENHLSQISWCQERSFHGRKVFVYFIMTKFLANTMNIFDWNTCVICSLVYSLIQHILDNHMTQTDQWELSQVITWYHPANQIINADSLWFIYK